MQIDSSIENVIDYISDAHVKSHIQYLNFKSTMKVPLSWLKEYVPTKLAPQEIAETLTLIGLEVESFKDDLLEIALTPNLAHCASILGVAREFAAITASSLLHPPLATLKESESEIMSQRTSVTVSNLKECPRYSCRLIQNVEVGPSPSWLKERIEAAGFRSVNNVVDITNYILTELGQPLHAFDFEKLMGGMIVVRNAKKNEQIETLDGRKFYLTEEQLIIADAQAPVAIAGVMGASKSEVGAQTNTILLESAYFEPTQIRRTSKRLGIQTEASYRFERGTDPNAVLIALERAAALICEIAGGECLKEIIDIKESSFSKKKVNCRLSRINHLLGTRLAMSEVETIFSRLDLIPIHVAEDLLTVHAPTYRHDLHEEIDLIEEVARFYGFGHLIKQEKAAYRTGSLVHNLEYSFGRKIREILIGEGLQEFLTCDLISPEQAALIAPENFPSRNLIKILNPRSGEQSIMRPSMLPGMLSVVKYNSNHAIHSLAGFEVGRIHFTSKERYFEHPAATIILTGQKSPLYWDEVGEAVNFYDLKGIIENLFQSLKINNLIFLPSHYPNFHPHRQAMIMIDQIDIGIAGQIHPNTLKKAGLEITREVYFAELNLEDLQRHLKTEIKMEPLPQYPASCRDWTVTLNEKINVGQILDHIDHAASPLLESVSVIRVYRSEKIGTALKNVTFRFVYRDLERTVSLATVEEEHKKIINTTTILLKEIT